MSVLERIMCALALFVLVGLLIWLDTTDPERIRARRELGEFVEVVNADTLRFEGGRLTVFGVDGPEPPPHHGCLQARSAGRVARDRLEELLQGRVVTATRIERHARDDLWFGEAEVDGENLSVLLYAEGLVVRSPHNARIWCQTQSVNAATP